MSSDQKTQHTLLQRAFDLGDQDAWNEFVGHYRKFIFYILHQINIPHDSIEDVSQQVLIALTRDLPNYDKSKSRFRTWLSAVIRNIAITHIRKESSYQSRLKKLSREPQPTETDSSQIDDLVEQEWTTYIATQAMHKVRKLFHGQAIQVFELSLEGQTTEAIAEQTGLTIASVYTLRKRVKKQLYIEILELTQNLEP